MARRARLQEGGGGGGARKRLDCHAPTSAHESLSAGGYDGNGKGPVLPAAPHDILSCCQGAALAGAQGPGAQAGDVLFASGFALSPEGLGEFVTHSGFLSVQSWRKYVRLETVGLRAGPSSFLRRSAALRLRVLSPRLRLQEKGPSESAGRAAGWGSPATGLLQDPRLGTQSTLGSQGGGQPSKPSGMQCSPCGGTQGGRTP